MEGRQGNSKGGLKEDQLHRDVQGRDEDESGGEDVIQVEALRSEAELQDVDEDDLQAPQEHGPVGVGGLGEADEREGPEGAEERRERQEGDVGRVRREDVVVKRPGRKQACKNGVRVYGGRRVGQRKNNPAGGDCVTVIPSSLHPKITLCARRAANPAPVLPLIHS